VGEDAKSRAAGDHRLAYIWPLRQHPIDQVGGFLEGVRADPLGSANGIALGFDHLGVKRGNAILGLWVIAVGLHRHLAPDLSPLFPIHDTKAAPESRFDDAILSRLNRPVGHVQPIGR